MTAPSPPAHPLRLVLLCSDEPHNAYLADLLTDRFDLRAVVVEPSRAQLQRRLRRHRYGDYLAGLYHQWRRRLNGYAAYRERYFSGRLPARPGRREPPCHRVAWINDPQTAETLRSCAPDAVVVISTSIIDAKILTICQGPVLNVHGGCLPHYKGNHCYFFALYQKAFDHIGSTIHFVGRGVDTGDMVEMVRPSLRGDDTPETLYCRGQMLAVHRLADWLDHYARGGVLPRTPQQPIGRAYRTRSRSPAHDLWFAIRRRMGRLRIPDRPAPPLPPLPTLARSEAAAH